MRQPLRRTEALRSRRLANRVRVSGGGVLSWDDGKRSYECSAQVRDTSDGGLQLLLSRAVPVGSTAYLTGETFQCLGTVRYCQASADGYAVGLSFVRDPYFRGRLRV